MKFEIEISEEDNEVLKTHFSKKNTRFCIDSYNIAVNNILKQIKEKQQQELEIKIRIILDKELCEKLHTYLLPTKHISGVSYNEMIMSVNNIREQIANQCMIQTFEQIQKHYCSSIEFIQSNLSNSV